MTEYLKSIQEKTKTSNKISIAQIEKIIYASIKYAEITHYNPMQAQIWQKFKSIKIFLKEQFQQQNVINNKLTIIKKQQVARIVSSKPQIWAAIVVSKKMRSCF